MDSSFLFRRFYNLFCGKVSICETVCS